MKHKQHGFAHLGLVLICLFILAVIGLAFAKVSRHPHSNQSNGASPSQSTSQSGGDSVLTKQQIATLPDITYYQTHKSDQFIVNMNLVQTGFPYLGSRSIMPHNGAHAQFGNDYASWPQGGTAPENYPPVYSPVDGYISEIQTNFHDYSKQPVDLYSIKIDFAKSDGSDWGFGFSLEPFVKEPSPGFYAKFIDVKVGQKVHKGDIIAHMYLSSAGGDNEHIHFGLTHASGTYAPAIFTPAIVQDFHNHWGEFGLERAPRTNGGTPIPVCMGYKLAANENPFGTGAVDCLQ